MQNHTLIGAIQPSQPVDKECPGNLPNAILCPRRRYLTAPADIPLIKDFCTIR